MGIDRDVLILGLWEGVRCRSISRAIAFVIRVIDSAYCTSPLTLGIQSI